MHTLAFKVVTANANEQAQKGGLLRLPRRSRALGALLRREGADLTIVQESGTYLAHWAVVARDFAASYGVPNTLTGDLRRGNGVLWANPEWRLLPVRERITVDIPNGSPKRGRRRGTRRLTLPIRRFEHRKTGVRVWVVAVHKPRAVAMYADSRALINERLAAWCLRHERELVIVAGDFNGAPPRLPGLYVVADHGPDSILASVAFGVHGPEQVLHLRALDISDHDAVARVLMLRVR